MLFFTFAFSVFGETFKFESQFLKYKLAFDDKNIVYKSTDVDLSLSNEKCINLTYSQLTDSIQLNLKKLEKNKPKTSFQIVYNNEVYFLTDESHQLTFFKTFIENLKKAKIEEEFACKKGP